MELEYIEDVTKKKAGGLPLGWGGGVCGAAGGGWAKPYFVVNVNQ